MPSTHNPWSDIDDFQRHVLKNTEPLSPGFLPAERMAHNVACLMEEVEKLREAIWEEDLTGVADALADLIYFAYGFAWQLGIPMDKIWDVVHTANMTKIRGMTKRGVDFDAAKPDTWVDPKGLIERILK